MTWEADGVLSVELVSCDGGELPPWEPGAHIDLDLFPGVSRQYSLCGDPADRRSYQVAVLQEPESRGGSRYVHETLRPGSEVGLQGLRNHFPLVDAPGYLFIAGGVGITPLLPMLEAAQASSRRWRLLYAGRSRRGMTFLDRLARHDDRVRLAPRDEGERLDLQAWFTHLRNRVPDAHVYCCGPDRLLDEVERLGAKHAVPVHLERFKAPQALPHPDTRAASSFKVELARTGRVFEVTEEQSVLDRLIDEGVDLVNDCREGLCGTCLVPVLAGELDHRDYVLTDRERLAANQMMVCVSRCSSDRLVLDL
jgi:ferredoxin-NADP reductase